MAKNDNNSYTLSLPAGSEITITIEVDFNKAKGAFAKTGDVYINGSKRTLINGFCVEFISVGEVSLPTGEDTKKDSIVYKHKLHSENRVYFYASSGETQVVNIINIPIHDHSSTVQGGPAFGTYYSDHESEEAPAE